MKILALGNETPDTDRRTSALALGNHSVNYGLISSADIEIHNDGYYHTSVADLTPGEIVELAKKFDSILLLDQPVDSYPNYKTFVTTIRLIDDLEVSGINVSYRDNLNAANFIQWRAFLKENKSFCFYPFLSLVDNIGSTTVCPKSRTAITTHDKIVNWRTDPHYTEIRNNMIAGTQMRDHCWDCYDRELEGEESTRQYETLEWTQRLNLKTPEDFLNFDSPIFYEIRPSNKCNIMCRTCDDGHSHLIEREWKSIGIPLMPWKFNNTPFDKINFKTLQRIYIGGGEPTVMPELYQFLSKCIEAGNTDFELNIGTNGMFFSDKLVALFDQFTNVCFSFSYDGYKQVNDYIRWQSDFDTIVDNGRMLRSRGHRIGLQTVFSMYSISRMHEVFEFYDQEYLGDGLLVQVGKGLDDIYMPFNHPRPDLVVESMRRCQQTKMYYMNGRSIKSMVDLILEYYSNPSYNCNVDKLREFYEYNDKLDKSRNSNLADYIPELAEARKLYNL